MKEYEIKYEPVILNDGTTKDKYNIYYYVNNELETKEFYAFDLQNPLTSIRFGYNLKTN